MPHKPEKYLWDMLQSIRFLMEFTAGRTVEELRNNRGFRSAVEREMQIIGEALMHLAKSWPEIAERISEHNRIISFRHVLVHGYDAINPDVVWNIIQNKLHLLSSEIEVLLKEGDESGASRE
jgi:uncharacterized protein with HEPN domain